MTPLLTRLDQPPITSSPQDIYVPALPASSDREGELKPVLFFVYGGGWKRGKRRNWFGLHQCVGESFAASGMITVLPDYTKVRVLGQVLPSAAAWCWASHPWYRL